jgi:acetylornithine deacetylase/succinyl-diaminopimelate desuccinylase-like protein
MSIDRREFVRDVAAGAAALSLTRGLQLHAAPRENQAAIQAEIERRAGETVARLQQWIRQPTIFAEGIGIKEGADLMATLARDAGFQKVEQIRTSSSGAPVVFGRLDAGARRTLALYFMYDVKQVNEREWSSPPFEARLVDHPEYGKVVMGRGAVNQTGPQAAFLAALHAIRGAGKRLPVNLVLVAEGEEEVSSASIAQAVRRPHVARALAGCQGIVMPSAAQNLDGTVNLSLGAKGIVEIELYASGERWGRGPRDREIHSSLKAAVDSPAWRLVLALGTLVSPDGNEPAIDGLEAMVKPLSAREKGFVADAVRRLDEGLFKKRLSIDRWARDVSFEEALARIASRPTVNIEGLVAGYTGPGGNTILPHEATAKLDIRLVPDMTATAVMKALRAHLDRRGYQDVEIRDLGSYDPTTTPYESVLVEAELAVYRARGIEPLISPRSGGSWPGYLFTGKPLALPTGHFGTGYGQGAHSKDELYLIESRSPRIDGMTGAVRSYVELLYAFAAA